MVLVRYREEIWQDYTATALSMIGQLFAKQWPLKPFHTMIDFDAMRKRADSRSGRQIMNDLVSKLGGV